ncbi:MAG: TIGR02757 family protein [Candidatus Latescibacteria bacterium]|nr:TIGR02757 family protein [bacterium]MBD3424731.1 TIGR02757 family protein [Candidatus Latescibacterota bacterium]
MTAKEKIKLREGLESLYCRYNRREYVGTDPVLFLYDYQNIRDREIAGLISSSLAFGNVKQIISSVGTVLNALGPSPHEVLLSDNPIDPGGRLDRFKHRWIDSRQIHRLLTSIRKAVRRYGSLENCFQSSMNGSAGDINSALIGFVDEIDGGCLRKGFLPCPERGSPCKRLNLYLRWMIRNDDVDPGGWSCASPSQLTVPLDTHMYRLARKLGLTERNQKDMKTALEITASFREISPEDPVKYDFALTRLGIINDRQMRELEEKLEGMSCRYAGAKQPRTN